MYLTGFGAKGTENVSGDGREKSFSVPSFASLIVLSPHLRSSLVSATHLSLTDYLPGCGVPCPYYAELVELRT